MIMGSIYVLYTYYIHNFDGNRISQKIFPSIFIVAKFKIDWFETLLLPNKVQDVWILHPDFEEKDFE